MGSNGPVGVEAPTGLFFAPGNGVAAIPWQRYVAPMVARTTAIEEAERAGFDLSLIDESLTLSYDQRGLQHQEALNLALELERAGRELRERSQPADPAAVRR